jgi:fumarate reductase subunit C
VSDARVTSAATQAKLWYWQRLSAMVLAVCVVIHLATIIYASRGGLTAAQILARTRGNAPFAVFYAVFVVACAVHVPIGLKAIVIEWLRWRERNASIAAVIIALFVLAMGVRAVYAVVV